MYKIGDFVVYKRDVCEVVDYIKKHINNKDYYKLVPVYDNTLKIDVPVDSSFLRNVLSKEEVEDIINNIPNIKVIDINDKLIENEYKKLLHEDGYEGLIKIIKTTYLRNNDRINNKRKISEKDDNYFNLAEKFLYGEFAISLGISYDEVKDYVINRVEQLNFDD
ncbi:MAG: hypothetical protein ACI4VL_01805 [Bacilli bacterium]